MNSEREFVRTIVRPDAIAESSGEYVMPDYQSDVRKILFSEAEIRPAGKFPCEDEVEFTGIVVYNVIYSDAEGKISGISFNSDYRLTVKLPNDNIENVFCEPRITNFALRLLSPRKLSAKCSVCASVRMNERQTFNVSGDAVEQKTLEKLERSVNLRVSSSSATGEREIAEEIKKLEGAIEDEVKVIYIKAVPASASARLNGEEATVGCRIKISALIENGDDSIFLAEKTVDIEQTLSYEGADGDTKLIPTILITSERANVRADEDGCTVIADVICEITVRGEGNTPVAIMSDAYLTDRPTANSYSDYKYSEIFDVLELNERHSAEINRSEIEEGLLREIPFVKAEPRLESVNVENGVAAVRGEVKYSGIASETNDDGSVSYSPIKYTAPFEKNVNLNCQKSDNLTVDARLYSFEADANIDANKIYLSSLLGVTLVASEDKCERILTECSAIDGEKYESAGACVTVYYPDDTETLFEVAKRFHVSLDRLAENNPAAVSAVNDGLAHPTVKKLLIF